MNKLKKKCFEIKLDIYSVSVFVCFLDLNLLYEYLINHKDFNGDIEYVKEKFKNMKNNYTGKVLQFENGNIIMYIPRNFKNQNYMVNTITHEVFHITHFVMDRIGLKLNFKSDEAFCYLNGYINEQIFTEI